VGNRRALKSLVPRERKERIFRLKREGRPRITGQSRRGQGEEKRQGAVGRYWMQRRAYVNAKSHVEEQTQASAGEGGKKKSSSRRGEEEGAQRRHGDRRKGLTERTKKKRKTEPRRERRVAETSSARKGERGGPAKAAPEGPKVAPLRPSKRHFNQERKESSNIFHREKEKKVLAHEFRIRTAERLRKGRVDSRMIGKASVSHPKKMGHRNYLLAK